MNGVSNTRARGVCLAALCACLMLALAITGSAQNIPSFAAHKEFIAGGAASTFAQGDLNNDGIMDIVVPLIDALEGAPNFALLLGNADGSFQAPEFVPTGAVAQGTALIADFNHDGKNDVAITTDLGISLLLGDGKGGFGAPHALAVPFPADLAAADLNGDGKLDLAFVDTSHSVSVLLGNGDGTFKAVRKFPVGGFALRIAIGDFNGDGHPDLAVTNASGSDPNASTVAILLGTGKGSFGAATFNRVADGPVGLAVSDFNHDGRQDVVVTNFLTDQVSILLGNGDGSFKTPVAFSVTSGVKTNIPYQPVSVAVDDFQGNGNLDLVVVNSFASTAAVLLGDGKGGFGKAANILLAVNPTAVLTGDYNHDGHRDFITADTDTGTVSQVLGKGNGKFQLEASLPAPDRADQIILADFNEDGIPDLATANAGFGSSAGTTASVYLRKKTAGASQDIIKVKTNPLSVASGDFNKDGHLDLVVANSGDPNAFGTGNLSVILGKGDGTFQAPNTVNIIQPPGDFPRDPRFLAAGDFNHDGNPDLVACTDDQGGVSLLPGDGKGGFRKPVLIHLKTACQQVLTADLNGDGEADLVVRLERNPDFPVVFALLGKGDGTFSTPQPLSLGDAFGIALGDLNHDGVLDLVIAEPFAIETLLGDGHGKFTSKGFFPGPRPSLFHPSLIPALGDFDGDGFLDVAIADELLQLTEILPGNGDGTLAPLQTFAGGGRESSALTAGDLNGDGRTDLVASGIDVRTGKGIVTLLLNNTPK